MNPNKETLEIDDVIFKMRNGSATDRLTIDRVVGTMAYSGKDYGFVRKNLNSITRVTEETGYTKLFGESFILETPENSAKHIREIKLRFIRNFRYDLLDDYNLRRIEKHLKTLNKQP